MSVRIKQAQYKDLNSMVDLFDQYRVFYRQESNKPLARDFISERLKKSDSIIFLAEDDQGRALGFTQLYPSFSSVSAKRLWILNDLFVKKEARQQGVAKMLMRTAKEHALNTQAKGLSLMTEVNNSNAQMLYESIGFKKNEDFYQYFLTV